MMRWKGMEGAFLYNSNEKKSSGSPHATPFLGLPHEIRVTGYIPGTRKGGPTCTRVR